MYELFSEYGFSEGQVEEIIKLSTAGTGKYLDAANRDYRIILHRRWFILAPRTDRSPNAHFIINKEDTEFEFSAGKLSFSSLPGSNITADPLTASLDEKKIIFPLLLRKAKTADYFYPLGMKKKKKISRFFIDNKLSKTEKEKAWVLESAGKIIWVLGQRLDERVKLTPSSEKTLRISWNRTE